MPDRPIDNMRSLLEGGAGQWIPFSLDVGPIAGFSPPVERTEEKVSGTIFGRFVASTASPQ